jgi:hypothetical protein
LNPFVRFRAIVSAVSLLAIACSSLPAGAVDRSDGDYWRYEVRFTVADVPVNGTIVYTYVWDDVLEINGTSHDVNVIRLEGSFSGSKNDSSVGVWVTGLLDGHRYEAKEGMGVLSEQLNTIINMSVGYDDFQIATYIETGETTTYSEPLMSGFDPTNQGQTSAWNETMEVHRTDTYSDGSASYENDSAAMTVFNISVLPESDPVETPAGSFASDVITVSVGNELERFWYSEDVGGFIRMERYDSLDGDPSFVAELTSYEYGLGGEDTESTLAALSVVLASAVLAVTILMVAQRRAKRHRSSEINDGGSKGSEGTDDEEVV